MYTGGNIDYKYLLALGAHPQIGSGTLRKILKVCPDPGVFWLHKKYEKEKIGQKIVNLIDEVVKTIDPDKNLENLKEKNIGFLTIFDKEYPVLLKDTPDCPTILYIRGSLDAINRKSIAVVGSRKFTEYGKSAAYKLSGDCARTGLGIISGLALGIDTIAHRAALDCGGITVGVLGCGLDRIYPASNLMLGRQIIENKGAIISEYPPGTIPTKFNFPMRNRIVAGLSLGTLVVEAAIGSGALITAYQALDYNREVFAVPGRIDAPVSIGANKLIQQGAKLVMSADDILTELGMDKAVMTDEVAKVSQAETDEEKTIFEILKNDEKLINQIVQESRLNIVAINVAITTLELKGLVLNCGGGRYRIK